VAIDAKADGTFAADIFLNNPSTVDRVSTQLTELKGNPVVSEFSSPVTSGRNEDARCKSSVSRYLGQWKRREYNGGSRIMPLLPAWDWSTKPID
jgi:hypothetical protein